ncbi:glycosyltransferase family 1 protein [Flammeovirga pectinis]|uniref:Glycosyltransferase family 1 protein n=1 Tax=Flammeovirga pectinis TaxID=2494373 RepID=A0A3Q9FV53_9BACT|nr:glycosyltransferase family 1 protein [Flammeovirga pectinis]AZQ65285.1 glycosyltransferase family 1 protein [Flammeovirga pectinis]
MMTNKDITLVSCQHFDSGIGRYSYQLGKGLRAINYNVELFKLYKQDHNDAYYHEEKWIKKIPYRSFKDLHSYILPYFIYQQLKKTPKSNLIHAHWFISGLSGSYLPNNLVVTMHDVSLLHIEETSNWFVGYYKWVINRLKKRRVPLLVVSENAKKDTIKYANYPEELIYVSYGYIDFDKFKPLINQIKNEKFTIIYTGGLGIRKNVSLLINAIKIVQKTHPNIEVKIAGAFPERTSYPKLVESLELTTVKFVGYLPENEINTFYNSADLFVFTSLYEGFGYTPLEAMAAGVPVISTCGGSLTEVIGDGGHLVDYNANELADAIIYYIDNETALKKLISEGTNWVKKYSKEASIAATLNAYKYY